MKTLTKLAKADLMTQQGYEHGDFTLNFTCFWVAFNNKSNKKANSVYAAYDIFDVKGVRESVHAFKLFDFGFVTPKGYKSTKALPVLLEDEQRLTIEQVRYLLQYKAEYKLNTFDPHYYENQAKSRNASAWNYIAANYITDPYCTR